MGKKSLYGVIIMRVMDELKSKLPQDHHQAIDRVLNRLGKYDVKRIEAYLETGAEIPVIITKRIDYAFSDAGYPDLTWKRVAKLYEKYGHEERFDFD